MATMFGPPTIGLHFEVERTVWVLSSFVFSNFGS